LGLRGQLGHGGYANELVPRLVQGLLGRRVIGLAAGYNHTVVCTSEGQLYTFGEGADGQLGHGAEANELVPRLVEGLPGSRVVGLASGLGDHSVVWTDDGTVYSIGYGDHGRLGHGDAESVCVPPALLEESFSLSLG
jgi:alpha-tubulin suppressor-like RCC1 family protein